MLQEIFKRTRLALKSYSMGREWDAGIEGNEGLMGKWKRVTSALRRDSDYDDIKDDLYEGVVRNLERFPHDASGLDTAIAEAIQHLAYPSDIYGEPVTVEAVKAYIDGLSSEQHADIVPTFSQERLDRATGRALAAAESREPVPV